MSNWFTAFRLESIGCRLRPTYKPIVEALEDRSLPATITFSQGGFAQAPTAWDAPQNWIGGNAPLPNDDVVIPVTDICDNWGNHTVNSIEVDGTFNNHNTLSTSSTNVVAILTNSGILFGGVVSNSGFINLRNNSRLQGFVTNNGVMLLGLAAATETGSLTNNGTIDFVDAVSTLNFSGSFTQTMNGTLVMYVANGVCSQLNVQQGAGAPLGGDATLAGTLTITGNAANRADVYAPITWVTSNGTLGPGMWTLGKYTFSSTYKAGGLALSVDDPIVWGVPPNVQSGQPFYAQLSWVSDIFAPGLTAQDYSVTIDWGNGTRSSADVENGPGDYVIWGGTTYASPGTYTVTIYLTDVVSNQTFVSQLQYTVY
jgi:hypothetical protein